MEAVFNFKCYENHLLIQMCSHVLNTIYKFDRPSPIIAYLQPRHKIVVKNFRLRKFETKVGDGDAARQHCCLVHDLEEVHASFHVK